MLSPIATMPWLWRTKTYEKFRREMGGGRCMGEGGGRERGEGRLMGKEKGVWSRGKGRGGNGEREGEGGRGREREGGGGREGGRWGEKEEVYVPHTRQTR
jgi:hypothetical protein